MAWWLGAAALERLARELEGLRGARVQQVHQVGVASVCVELRAPGQTLSLLLDGGESPVLGLVVARPRREQEQAPAFQGLLRKHLAVARLAGVSADAGARCARVEMEVPGGARLLVMEWRRDAPNVLLVHDNGVVLGAGHAAALRVRGLRVGRPYVAPAPVPGPPGPPLPPVPHLPGDHPWLAFPTHVLVDQARQGGVLRPLRAGSPLRRRVKAELDRADRLCRALGGDLERSREASRFRTAGERAKAQWSDLVVGVGEWVLADPAEPGAPPVEVTVDPASSVARNVDRLFHRARRLERTGEHARAALEGARARREALRALVVGLDAGEDPAVAEEGLARLGARPAPAVRPGRAGPPRHLPFRAFTTRDGWRILCGKSTGENDLLTHTVARGGDIFLHARDTQGSHVVLVVQGERPGLRAALEVAALVAAHHSRARGERTVDVRTTEVKHVRRVPGSPGLVTVAHERVVRVSLDDPRLAAILLTRQDTDTRLGG